MRKTWIACGYRDKYDESGYFSGQSSPYYLTKNFRGEFRWKKCAKVEALKFNSIYKAFKFAQRGYDEHRVIDSVGYVEYKRRG